AIILTRLFLGALKAVWSISEPVVELSDAPRTGARNRFLASFIGKLLDALLERLHTESIGQKVKGFGAGLDPTRGFGSFRDRQIWISRLTSLVRQRTAPCR